MNNQNRYNQTNNILFGNNRGIWHGLYGDEIHSDISIENFVINTSIFKNIYFKNTLNFYNKIKEISYKYKDWCSSIDKTLSEEELQNIQLFFIGEFGEIFFSKVLKNKSLIIKNENLQFTFRNICTRLIDETDFGVDLTGTVYLSNGKNHDCVFQVKFWSPYSDKSFIENHLVQCVHSDAIENNFINNDDDKNIFICWLGDMNHISKWININKLRRHIVFIDRSVLKDNIDSDIEFWDDLNKEFNNI